ncbi:hypothetical protein D8T49_21915 [Vibrio vulnificus]|nr:hypothetical protein [Vibrio vulnificus]EGQ7700414.1 hypothetical protein [Vibrio vulnificus]EGQ8176388.1 hypothetical protein [Vibrio vulnificus]EGQ9240261.1 hypothetical protein [Vibrio vulnificus]EGQ9330138.1 hypothetical protein [Vibrio vulnificus]EGR0089038.1 hypothetical protein [Vibrio vulnificus]
MKFIPYHDFQFDSELSKDEVLNKIQDRIDKPTTPRRWKRKEFTGSVFTNSFDISKNLRRRNSFSPIIKGCIEDIDTGARITILMRMHPLIIVLMLFWLAFIGVSSVVMLYRAENIELVLFIPIIMFFFGLVFPPVSFWSEVRRQETRIRELLSTN